eukprot:3856792-Amphidinium_carterae.1
MNDTRSAGSAADQLKRSACNVSVTTLILSQMTVIDHTSRTKSLRNNSFLSCSFTSSHDSSVSWYNELVIHGQYRQLIHRDHATCVHL